MDAPVLDSLATRGFAVIPNWMTAEDAKSLATVARIRAQAGLFKPAGVGREGSTQLNADVRRDEISWLEPRQTHEIDALLVRFEALKRAMNEAFFVGLHDFEAHFAHYPPGGFYVRHVDRFRDDDKRTISGVLYLNENWSLGDGGELEIQLDSEVLTVEPRLGTLVLFDSAKIEHGVKASLRDRWSVACWFRRR